MQKQTRRRSLSPASPARTRSVSKEGGIKRAQSNPRLTKGTKSTVIKKSMSNAVTGEASVTTQSISITTNSVSISSSNLAFSSDNVATTGHSINNPTTRVTDQTASSGSSSLPGNGVHNSTVQSQGKSTTVTVIASNLSVSSSTTSVVPRTSAVSSSVLIMSSAAAVITSSVNTGSSAPGVIFSTPLIQPMAQSAGQPSGVTTVRDVEWPEGSDALRLMFNSLTESQKQEISNCLQALKYMRQRLRTSFLMEGVVNGRLNATMYAILLSLSLSIPPTESE